MSWICFCLVRVKRLFFEMTTPISMKVLSNTLWQPLRIIITITLLALPIKTKVYQRKLVQVYSQRARNYTTQQWHLMINHPKKTQKHRNPKVTFKESQWAKNTLDMKNHLKRILLSANQLKNWMQWANNCCTRLSIWSQCPNLNYKQSLL